MIYFTDIIILNSFEPILFSIFKVNKSKSHNLPCHLFGCINSFSSSQLNLPLKFWSKPKMSIALLTTNSYSLIKLK